MNKKTPYTAETFPMDAVWVRFIGEDERFVISIVKKNGICYGSAGVITYDSCDEIEIASTDGVWKPFYQEEKPWHENIPKEGVWCWVWSPVFSSKKAEKVRAYVGGIRRPSSLDEEGLESYENATPLTEEEKEKYLINYKA